jgi:alanyl-tRNA synthetase
LCQEVATKNGETIFTGYEQLKTNAKILSLSDGENKVQTLKSGESGILICTATPFYAEGGGQAGDVGTISNNHFKASVLSTTKINGIFLHHIRIEQGSAETSQAIDMTVTSNIRRQTMSNHSATHLLQAALRNVLGNHVTQAGSQVDSNRLRFDFTHNKPLSEADVIAVENLVNMQISNTLKVTPATMSYKEALKTGAMALFGEKYGDNVRVLTMGDFSTELCGGTHVGNTSEIRVFKITSESGVSSGVRRIEAISGDSAVAFLQSSQEETQKARAAANIQSNQSLTDWIEAKKSEIKNLERQLRQTQGDQINIDEICKNAKTFQAKGLAAKLVTIELQFDDRELLAKINDQIKNKIQTGVVVVLGKGSDSHPMIVSVTKDLNPGISAGGILKDLAAILGGKGGGRPDFAQGAVPNRDQFKEAFEKAEVLLGVKS